MPGSSGSVRAGRAFVEMVLQDESVKTSLEEVQTKLRTFGTAVDAIGTTSFSRMSSTAVAGTVATGASVGVLTATMGVLNASVYAVGNAFRVVFARATTSVTKAFTVLSVLAATAGTYLPGGKIAGFLKNFVNKSETTEAVGRWVRFAGLITGSSVFKDMGKRIERLGLGASIVKGFQTGGFFGGINAAFGAGIRSLKSVVTSSIGGAIAYPFRIFALGLGGISGRIKSMFGGAKLGGGILSPGATGGAIATAAGSANVLAAGLNNSASSGVRLFNVMGRLGAIGGIISGMAIKVGGLAAVIMGPALLAAKKFVTQSEEIMKEFKEKFGKPESFKLDKNQMSKASNKQYVDEIRRRVAIHQAANREIEKISRSTFGKTGIVKAEDIRAADELGTTMTKLGRSTAAAWAQVGAAALPVLKKITETALKWMDVAGGFMSKNRQLMTTVIQVAAKVAGFSAGIVALYGAFLAATPIVGMLLTPLGLLAAGIAAITYLFPKFRGEAIAVFEYLFGGFTKLGTIAGETMTGIANALSGGSLQAAARVLWAGLNLAWVDGAAGLNATFKEATNIMVGNWINGLALLRSAWVEFGRFLADAIMVSVMNFRTLWQDAIDAIAMAIASPENRAALKEQQKAERDALNKSAVNPTLQGITDADKRAKAALDEIEKQRKAMLGANDEIGEAKRQQAKEDLEAAKKEFKAAQDAAKALAGKNTSPGGATTLKDTLTLSSFSIAGVGRQNIGGLLELKSIMNSTEQIAKNTDPKNGMKVAP